MNSKKGNSSKKISPDKKRKRHLLWLQVIIAAITFLAVAIAIFLNNRNHRETVRLATEQFNQQQLILAREAATGIEHFIVYLDDDLLALSKFPVVQRMASGILERMKVLYMGIPPQTSSRRLDKNGILRFIYPNEGWRKELIGRDYSENAYFQRNDNKFVQEKECNQYIPCSFSSIIRVNDLTLKP